MSHLEDVANLSDSSIESEGDLIRTGDIPQKEWYEKELHDGYDIDGKKIFVRGMDNIDTFLLSKDKQELKRRIYDLKNDAVMRINDRDLSMINRIRKGKCASKMAAFEIPKSSVFDITTHGIRAKSSFTVSKSDYAQILKNVKAIKNGWLRVDKYGQIKEEFDAKKRMDAFRAKSAFKSADGDIWSKSNIKVQSRQMLTAPKTRLPNNYESYNPSFEYRNGRNYNYASLRKVPQFERFIHDRFERCLDLYLLPRKIGTKRIIAASNLLPLLPDIESLRPYPELLTCEYYGHSAVINCIDLSYSGEWIVSGDSDGCVIVFEVDTGKPCFRHSFGKDSPVQFVQFNPMYTHSSLLSVITQDRCFLVAIEELNLACHHKYITEHIHTLKSDPTHKCGHGWTKNKHNQVMITFLHSCPSALKWHSKGDYFVTFTIGNSNAVRSGVTIHRWSRFSSIEPFQSKKILSNISDVVWHPRKPLLYIACKQSIHCFNLKKCALQESYVVRTSWLNRLDLHPSGLNMIVCGYDGKVSWYDMDLSHSPFKTFNYHGNSIVRNVIFHKNSKYNHLWASAADDGKIYIFYCKMFRKQFIDPILIPLKILQVKKHRVLDIKWHKTQPWIFAACSDGIMRLYTAL